MKKKWYKEEILYMAASAALAITFKDSWVGYLFGVLFIIIIISIFVNQLKWLTKEL